MSDDRPAPSQAWSSVTVGVASLDDALRLWVDAFGFDIEQRLDSASPSFAALWDIAPADVSGQALLAAAGSPNGRVHLVEFTDPAPPVRAGAAVFDRCAKNLDVYVSDMPARIEALRERGYAFRNETCSEVEAPDGTRFREIHMDGHDAINIVLLEVLGQDRAVSERGFGGVGPLIVIVADAAAEKTFFAEVMGLTQLADNVLAGPEIEAMIGLPKGAALDVSIWGDPDRPNGQIEIIHYRGVDGRDLYPRARPKATGILGVSYDGAAAAAAGARLRQAGVACRRHAAVEFPERTADVVEFRSPAGLTIQLRGNA